MSRVGRFRLLTFALCALVAALAPCAGLSQDAPAEAAPAAPPAAAPAPPPPTYTASEIPRAAERASSVIRKVRAKIADPAWIEASRLEIDTLAASIGRIETFTSSRDLATLSDRFLGALQQRWGIAQDDLRRALRPIEKSGRDLEAHAAALRELRDRWERTRALAVAEEFPPALIDRVSQTLSAIEKTEEELRAPRDQVALILGRISDLQVSVESALESLTAAREDAARRVLTADDVPLWRVEAQDAERGVGAALNRSARQVLRGVYDLRESYGSRLLLHLALLIALLVTMVVVSRRSQIQELSAGDDAMQAAARILKRPFASSLLATLLLTPSLYPRASLVVFDLNALLIFLPAIRLLPRAIIGAKRGPFYGLLVLFVLDQARKLAVDGSSLQRLLLVVVTVAAIGEFLWIRRSVVSTADTALRGQRVVRKASVLAAAVCLFSLGGNMLGFVRLSTLMTATTLGATYLALVLFAATLALEGLFALLLRLPMLASLRVVSLHSVTIARGFSKLLRLVALVFFVIVTLSLASVWTTTWSAITAVLSHDLSIGSLTISLGDVLAFFAALLIAVFFSRALRAVLRDDVFPRMRLARGIPETIAMLVNYGVIAIGVLFAAAAAGIEIDRIALVASALGVGIGFGLQTLVNNFVSGLILAFERPVQIGDEVEVGQLLGVVKRIGIRASTIRTFNGSEVIIPNGNLLAGELINWTLSDVLRRIDIPVGVAYGTDPRLVIETLLGALAEVPEAMEDPRPVALFRAFGESSLDFELRFWINKAEGWPVIVSNAKIAVHDALQQADIEVPFPQRDLHLRSSSIGPIDVAPEAEPR